MKSARTAFVLMWIVPPIVCTAFSALYRITPAALHNAVVVMGLIAIAVSVIWIMRMADPSSRQSAASKVKMIPLKTKNDDTQYMLTDDGEIMEVVDDEKPKRGVESRVE